MKLTGIFVLRLGVESLMGRVFTRESVEKIIELFEAKVKSGMTMIGDVIPDAELENSSNPPEVSLNDATHFVDSLYIGGDNEDILYADITLLEGLSDDVIESILKGDLLLSIALFGAIGYDGEVIPDDFIKLYFMNSRFSTFSHCFYVPVNFWEKAEDSLVPIGE